MCASSIRVAPVGDCASRTANAYIDEAHRDRVYRPQGWVSPVALADGRMVGVSRHEVKGGRVLVEVTAFESVAAWVRGVGTEAERLATSSAAPSSCVGLDNAQTGAPTRSPQPVPKRRAGKSQTSVR